MNRIALAASLCVGVLMVSGCAPSLEGFNERGGIVRNTGFGMNMSGVFAMADAACHQYGRVARVSGTELQVSDTVSFDCVAP